MKKAKRLHTLSLKKLLFEQEEEENVFDEPADEEADDEEAADDEGDDTEEEGGEAAEEEDSDDESSDSLENVESIDSDIEAVLIDFETSARKSAVQESSTRVIYESEESFDVDSFAADVARLVKNYDNLLDIEGMLVNKSKSFLSDRYGDEVVSAFVDRLESQHDIEEPTSGDPIPSTDLETPLAVGAGASGE